MRLKKTVVAVLCVFGIACVSGCKEVNEEIVTNPEVITATQQTTVADNVNTEDTYKTTAEESHTTAETEVAGTVTETEKSEVTESITTYNNTTTTKSVETNQSTPTTIITTSQTTETKETTTVTTEKSETSVTSQNLSYNFSQNGYTALNYNEQKGFWISYLEYDTIIKNKSEKQFRSYINKYFDNILDAGFNTVYVHARAFGDAYYYSELFPAGDRFIESMNGTIPYDALQIMIDEAHERNISVHAWVNPMRLMTETQMQSVSDTFKFKQWYNNSDTNGRYIVYVNGRWFLNPAYDEVIQFICDGVKEIVSAYNIDGIQIDDYFYPTISASFDSSAYKTSGTSLSLYNWRLQNTSNLVKKMYNAVHSVNQSVLFGISPQGSVENNYTELYADVKKWGSVSGYCDYLLPQIYFGFDNSTLPYNATIKEWSNIVSNSNVKLVIGLAGYKIGAVDKYAGDGKNEWVNNNDIILRQMESAESLNNYGGVSIYRYDSIFNPSSDVAKQVNIELSNIEKSK